jgi:hypothetical protein
MQMLATTSERLRALLDRQIRTRKREVFSTGLDAMDEVAPFGGFRCGAIHELLFDRIAPTPKLLAMLLARSAQKAMHGAIVWSDPRRELNPTAMQLAEIDLRRLIFLRPRNSVQEISALAECLRCRGVSAVVSHLGRLSDIEARRLQLAVECGGGIGIFLRPMTKQAPSNYAAATRWLVCPALEGEAQCWTIQLLHGHGGRLGSSVLLEVDRETGDVRASEKLRNRQAATPSERITA